MTRERFQRIRGLYEAAVSLDESDRAAFLQNECQDDTDLRTEIERLLKAREHGANWIRAPRHAPPDRFLDSAGNPAPQIERRRIGEYQILREIGQGGMGTVYLAERADGIIHKQVAIKLVRPELNDPDLLNRFRREREILASLDHPAIARLIDGGSTEEGLPYLIMDYIEGQPIDEWCDQRRLNVTERLILFRSACAAVQHAHQHLVVHRDLKPAHILVTADGAIKLLDFGIAKLLEPQPSANSQQPTVTLMRRMTPAYASPEQVKGDTITTLSDVYSLGVVLYRLLTGHAPYRLRNSVPHEVMRLICEEEPMRPSEVVRTGVNEGEDPGGVKHPVTPEAVSAVREEDPARLEQRLKGDLDSILLMALRKEPARRYSSVEQFSEDLRRHLEHLPVMARPDTLRYRIGKLVRRHPGSVVAAFLIVLSIVGGLITTLWEAKIAVESRREAEAVLKEARQQRSEPRAGAAEDGQGRRPDPQSVAHGRTILLPQVVFFNYAALLGFVVAVYFSRASAIRVVGALIGGGVIEIALLCENKLTYAKGWWHGGFPGVEDTFVAMSTAIIWFGAMLTLILWRFTRRFGWRGQALFIFTIGIYGAIRQRAVGSLTGLMIITPGIIPFIVDAASWALAFALAQGAMRMIAGPAGSDRLARTQ